MSFHSPLLLDAAPADWASLCTAHRLCHVAVPERHGWNGNVARSVLGEHPGVLSKLKIEPRRPGNLS